MKLTTLAIILFCIGTVLLFSESIIGKKNTNKRTRDVAGSVIIAISVLLALYSELWA